MLSTADRRLIVDGRGRPASPAAQEWLHGPLSHALRRGPDEESLNSGPKTGEEGLSALRTTTVAGPAGPIGAVSLDPWRHRRRRGAGGPGGGPGPNPMTPRPRGRTPRSIPVLVEAGPVGKTRGSPAQAATAPRAPGRPTTGRAGCFSFSQPPHATVDTRTRREPDRDSTGRCPAAPARHHHDGATTARSRSGTPVGDTARGTCGSSGSDPCARPARASRNICQAGVRPYQVRSIGRTPMKREDQGKQLDPYPRCAG